MNEEEYILDGLTTYVENQHSRTLPNMFKSRKNGELERFFAYSYDDFSAKEILKQVKDNCMDTYDIVSFLSLLVDELCSKCFNYDRKMNRNIFISFYEVSMELLDIVYILQQDYREKEEI